MFRILTVIATLCIVGILHAQTQPSTSVSLPPGPIKVTVTGVTGIVQFRTGADGKWEKAAEGTELSEGAELRTGPPGGAAPGTQSHTRRRDARPRDD